MESGIKYYNLRNIFAEYLCTSIDTLNVSGVVERSKRSKLFNLLDNIVCYENRLIKLAAALHYSVTDCANL